MNQDTKCQGGCGKVRSILCADRGPKGDVPKDWLCFECWKRNNDNHGQAPEFVPVQSQRNI